MSKDRCNRISYRTGAFLRLVLIVSMWQAPIPWVHSHSFEANEVSGDKELRRHLVHFHRDALTQPNTDLGWHIHFELPADLLGAPLDDEGSAPSPPHESACQLELSSSAGPRLEPGSMPGGESVADLLANPSRVEMRTSQKDEHLQDGNFLGTFLDSVEINVLICVARR